MHLNKLITHLRQLNREQLGRLSDFVHSPYFKVPVSAVVLFDYLEKLYPEYDERRIQAQLIAKKAKELPTANKQAKAGTELLKAIERFLAVERWHGKELNLVIETLWEQAHLHWIALYDDNLKRAHELLDEDKERNIDYFYNLHLLTTIEHHDFRRHVKRDFIKDIQPVVKTLDDFYALKKLRYHCELLNRNKLLGAAYNKENIDQILEWLVPYDNADYPYVYLFVNTYKMQNAADFGEAAKHYLLLKRYIESVSEKNLNQAVKECLDYIGSVGTYWFNLGHLESGNWFLWCTALKVKHNRFLVQGKIPAMILRNIVSVAVTIGKDAAWIKKFIDTYTPCLPPENAEVTTAFVYAQYYFYVKKYKESLRLYQQALEKEVPVLNAATRRWQFMCLYEDDPENKSVLMDFLAAYEKYIKRNPDDLRQFESAFMRVITYSKQVVLSTSKKQRDKVITALEGEMYFIGKPWLLTQLKKG